MVDPRLSVVLTVVDGGAALRRCLSALLAQDGGPPMEILVPYDSTMTSVASVIDEAALPAPGVTVRGLDLGRIDTRHPPLSARGQHELIDRRRSAGLREAAAGIVAIVEDRGVPRKDWAANVIRLHNTLPHVVIGGAIENGRDRVLNWAVYFCDFGRYQRPFAPGPRRYISDVNVAYKRRALDETREIWQLRYHEPWVHWALERRGETLFASPDVVVDQIRDHLKLSGLIRERLAWGRLFGSLRARDASIGRRAGWVALSPLVPFVLFGRLVRDRLSKRRAIGRFVAAAPAAALLVCAWAAGEAAGALASDA